MGLPNMGGPVYRLEDLAQTNQITMRAPGRYRFYHVWLAVGLSLLVGITQAGELETTAHRLQAPFAIEFANDRLSVKIEGIALRELLREIARQSGLTVMVSGPLEERVTIEFQQLLLDKGLRRILRRQNFVVEYAVPRHDEPPSTHARPKTLWVVAKGTPSHRMQHLVVETRRAGATDEVDPVDIRKWQAASKSEDVIDSVNAIEALGDSEHPDAVLSLRSALTDEDEEVREAAIAALTEIGGEAAANALSIALRDDDVALREDAVAALGIIGGEAAAQALSIALYDGDVSIREDALAVLAEIGGEAAVRLLAQALADENEAIREAAAKVLTGLEGRTLEGDTRKAAPSSGKGVLLPRGQEGRQRSSVLSTQQRYRESN